MIINRHANRSPFSFNKTPARIRTASVCSATAGRTSTLAPPRPPPLVGLTSQGMFDFTVTHKLDNSPEFANILREISGPANRAIDRTVTGFEWLSTSIPDIAKTLTMLVIGGYLVYSVCSNLISPAMTTGLRALLSLIAPSAVLADVDALLQPGEIVSQGPSPALLGSVLATIILGATVSTGSNRPLIQRLVAGFSTHSRVITGLSDLSSFLLEMSELAINWVLGQFSMPAIELYAKGNAEVTAWIRDVQLALQREFSDPGFALRDEVEHIIELMERGDALYLENVRTPEVRIHIAPVQARLRALADSCKHIIARRGGHRVKPVFLLLRGAPGAGKSVAVTQLINYLVAKCITRERFQAAGSNPERFVHYRLDAEFWDGYAGEFITVVDDLFTKVLTPGETHTTAEHLMHILGDMPVSLNMAFGDKGKVFFKSSVVIGTTNTGNMAEISKVIKHPNALLRRMHDTYEVTIADGWGVVRNGVPEFDFERFKVETSVPGPIPWHAFSCRRYSMEHGAYGGPISLEDIAKAAVAEVADNLAHFERRPTRQSAVVDYYQSQSGISDALVRGYSWALATCVVGRPAEPDEVWHDARDDLDDGRPGIPWGDISVVQGAAHQVQLACQAASKDIRDSCKFMASNSTDINPIFKALALFAVGGVLLLLVKKFAELIHAFVHKPKQPYKVPDDVLKDLKRAGYDKQRYLMAISRAISPTELLPEGKLLVDPSHGPAMIARANAIYSQMGLVGLPHDSPLDGVANRFTRNTWYAIIKNKDGFTAIGQFIVISADVVLACAHYLSQLRRNMLAGRLDPDTLITFEPVFIPRCAAIEVTLQSLLNCDSHVLPDSDAVLIRIPGLHSTREVLSLFASEVVVNSLHSPEVRLEFFTRQASGDYTPRTAGAVADVKDTFQHRDAPGGEEQRLSRGLSYRIKTYKGQCGSLILLDSGKHIRAPAIGMHVAGDNVQRGFSNILTQELLVAGIKALDSHIDEHDPEVLFSQNGAYVAGGSMVEVGVIKRGFSRSPASGLVRSVLHGVVTASRERPAPLGSFRRGDVYVNPLHRALERDSPARTPYSLDHARELASAVFAKIHRATKGWSRRILTFEQAVAGIPGDPLFSSIPRITSPGWPYVRDGITSKHHFFGSGDVFDFSRPEAQELRRTVEEAIAKMESGVRPIFYYSDTLKDETRSLEKVAAGDTRLISASPIVLLIAMRMYLGDFSRAMIGTRIENGQAVGINPATEWGTLSAHLTRHGPCVCDGDQKSHDSRIHAVKPLAVGEQVNIWYSGSPAESRVRKILFYEIAYSRHITNTGPGSQCQVFQRNGSHPSGGFLTSIFGGIYTDMGKTHSFMKRNPGAEIDKFVSSIHYGDDNAHGSSKATAETYNFYTIRDDEAELGMLYTSSTKDDLNPPPYRELPQCTFIGRGFTHDENTQAYLCPLKLDTIHEIVQWSTKGSNTDQVAFDNIENTLRELSQHTVAVWNEWAPRYVKASVTVLGRAPANGANRAAWQTRFANEVPYWSKGDATPIDDIESQSGLAEGHLATSVVSIAEDVNPLDHVGAEHGETVTGFVGNSCHTVAAFSNRRQPNANVRKDTATVSDIPSYLSRPYLLTTASWPTSGTASVYKFTASASSCSAHPAWAYLAKNSFVSFSMTFRIEVVADPTQSGLLIAAYEPFQPRWTIDAARPALYQLPHSTINLADANATEITVPWLLPIAGVSPSDPLTIGTLYITPVSVLRSAANTPVPVNVYLSFSEVNTIGAAPSGTTSQALGNWLTTQSGIGVQGAEVKHVGRFTAMLRNASAVASYVSSVSGPIPLLSVTSSAAAAIAAAMSSVTAHFGWSRPIVSDPPGVQVDATHDSEWSGEGASNTINPTLVPTNYIPASAIGGTGVDEMSFAFLAGKSGLIGVKTWTTAQAVNTTLATITLSPDALYFTSGSNVALTTTYNTLVYNAVWVTPIMKLANCFDLWACDLIFDFEIVASAFHGGKLRVTYIPPRPDLVGVPVLAAQSADAQTQVVDIRGVQRFSFEAAFLSQTKFLPHRGNFGVVQLQVHSPLIASSTVSSTVDVAITVRAQNAVFAGPRDPSNFFDPPLSATVWSQSGIDLGTIHSRSTTTPADAIACSGEVIGSIKVLMQRACRIMTISANTAVLHPCDISPGYTGAGPLGYFGYFRGDYAVWAGSVAFSVSSAVSPTAGIMPTPTSYRATATPLALAVGTTPAPLHSQGHISVRVPYVNTSPFYSTYQYRLYGGFELPTVNIHVVGTTNSVTVRACDDMILGIHLGSVPQSIRAPWDYGTSAYGTTNTATAPAVGGNTSANIAGTSSTTTRELAYDASEVEQPYAGPMPGDFGEAPPGYPGTRDITITIPHIGQATFSHSTSPRPPDGALSEHPSTLRRRSSSGLPPLPPPPGVPPGAVAN